jgi:hypothetical protein
VPFALLGFASGLGPVDLAGTVGVPRQAYDSSIDPNLATVDWDFRTDGGVYKVEGFSAPLETQDNASTTWYPNGTPPTGRFWIRFTVDSGDTPDTGDSMSTWHTLASTDRTFGYNRSGTGQDRGVIKVEIATDSGGSSIVATGYYEGWVDVSAK